MPVSVFTVKKRAKFIIIKKRSNDSLGLHATPASPSAGARDTAPVPASARARCGASPAICHFPTLCNKRKRSAFTLSGESVRMGFAVFEDADAADQTVASKEAGPRPAVKIGVPNIGFAEISKPVSSSSPAPCRQTANKGIGKRPAVTLSTPFRLLYGSCAGAGGGVQLGEFSAGRREETGKPKSKFNPQG